jgi:hypothetical protein
MNGRNWQLEVELLEVQAVEAREMLSCAIVARLRIDPVLRRAHEHMVACEQRLVEAKRSARSGGQN